MRTPHLSTALLTTAALAGVGFSTASPTSFEIKNEPPLGFKEGFTPSRRRRNKSSVLSQRQLRKNKRRKHAAGFKKAFN